MGVKRKRVLWQQCESFFNASRFLLYFSFNCDHWLSIFSAWLPVEMSSAGKEADWFCVWETSDYYWSWKLSWGQQSRRPTWPDNYWNWVKRWWQHSVKTLLGNEADAYRWWQCSDKQWKATNLTARYCDLGLWCNLCACVSVNQNFAVIFKSNSCQRVALSLSDFLPAKQNWVCIISWACIWFFNCLLMLKLQLHECC